MARSTKRLSTLSLMAMLSLMACQAFNENAGEPILPLPAESPGGGEGGEVDKTDYSVDKTECAPVAGITVKESEKSSLVASAGWTTEGDKIVTATKVGEFSTKITIQGGKQSLMTPLGMNSLEFTVKKTGSHAYSVCNLSMKGWSTSTISGTIVVDRFNAQGDDGKVLNAGSYQLSASPASTEPAEPATTKAEPAEPVTEAPSPASAIAGIYYVEALGDTPPPPAVVSPEAPVVPEGAKPPLTPATPEAPTPTPVVPLKAMGILLN